jgi:hypothetical protein
MGKPSCGTVALYGLFIKKNSWQTIKMSSNKLHMVISTVCDVISNVKLLIQIKSLFLIFNKRKRF